MENGKEEEYNELIFRSYFVEEQDIGDLDVLCDIVKKIGLNAGKYRKALEKGIYAEKQAEQNRIARETYRPEGVPTIYINGQKQEPESYTPEEMKIILQSIPRR